MSQVIDYSVYNVPRTSWYEYFSAEGRAKAAIFLIFAVLAFNFTVGWSYYQQKLLLDRASTGQLVTKDEVLENQFSRVSLLTFNGVIGLVTVVMFCRWLHRAYENLRAFPREEPKYTPGWAVASFFIPFVNFVRPMLVLRDAWLCSAGDDPKDRDTSMVTIWWLTYLLPGPLLAVLTIMSIGVNASPADRLMAESINGMMQPFIALPAGYLAIAMIRRITQMQEAKADALASATTPPPLPVTSTM